MMKKLIVFVFLSFFAIGCNSGKVLKPDDSYDQTEISKIGYNNYAGYLSSDDNILNEAELEAWDYDWDNYLRLCGGLWPVGYVLTGEDDMTISTQADLQSYLQKIDSPKKAMAYVYATNCYLSAEFDDVQQFVNYHPEGYLVSVIYYNFIGCGNHAHRQLGILVKENGDWEVLSDIKLERGEEYCGD